MLFLVVVVIAYPIQPSHASVVSTFSTTASKSDIHLKSRIELGAQHFQTALSDESAQSYLGFGSQYVHDISDFIQFELSPFLFVRSGYIQSDLYEPGNNNGVITLEHAALKFHNGTHLFFGQIGIIQASRYTSPIVLSRVGNTGMLAGINYPLEMENSSVELVQQLNIPNSFQQNYTFDQRAQIPKLQMTTARITYESQSWGVRSHLGYFQAQDLSESLAENSNLRGNTIIFSSDTRRTRFVFNYNVIEAYVDAYFYFSKSNTLGLSLSRVQNLSAPNGLNQGFLIEPKIDLQLGSLRYKMSYQFFNIEPDAVISSLNSPLFESNRVGQRVTLSVAPNKANTFTLRFAERNVVYTHPFQQHEFLTSFEWETRYDIL